MAGVDSVLLCQQEQKVGESLTFILVLLVSILLSGEATEQQRRGLCRLRMGETEKLPDVFCLRLPASLLVIVALTFFFELALENWEGSREQTCREQESARLNVWAALFVLVAALIRLYDLTCVQVRT